MADPTSTATGTTAGTMAGMSEDDLKNLMAMLQGGQKGGAGAYNTANLSALTEKPMGLDPYMTAAGIGGAAIPFVQALRLGREVNKYKPTNLVPRQAYDVVQNLSQQVNAPATNYGQRLQEINAARAARMAQARKGGTASNYLRALFGSEEMFNKASRDLGAQGAAEKVQRMAAYNQALGNLGAQEAASAERNRQTLAALKQARDLNYQKSAEGLINNLLNSVVLKNPKTPVERTTHDDIDFLQTKATPKGVFKTGYPDPYKINPNLPFDPNLRRTRIPSMAEAQEIDNPETGYTVNWGNFLPRSGSSINIGAPFSTEGFNLPPEALMPPPAGGASPFDVNPYPDPFGVSLPSNYRTKQPKGF